MQNVATPSQSRVPGPQLNRADHPVVSSILDLARWAPSGDNTQPWRFEVVGPSHIAVHCFDTSDHCVYDLDGHGSHLAIGALLETIRIAASQHGRRCEISNRHGEPQTHPVYDVHFQDDPKVEPDPLLPHITERVTQRRPMKTRTLADEHRKTLEQSVGEGFSVRWIEGAEKKAIAKILFRNAHIRLTIPEAYEVHRQIIQWRAQFSEDRIPDQAVGLDPVALRLMEWVMGSWRRVQFMNRFMAGTWMPRIQLDVIPARRCAAHALIVTNTPPHSLDDFVAGGMAMQRFWLTATKCDLRFQPEMTPLIFNRYLREGVKFTEDQRAGRNAKILTQELIDLVGADVPQRSVYMARVGYGPTPTSRSIRPQLEQLMYSGAAT